MDAAERLEGPGFRKWDRHALLGLLGGSVVTYPATTLHRVTPVTRGERLAAAGWVRSYVRDPARRELLFDLETARRRLFGREGKTGDADLLAKCAANLMRMWCED